MSVLEWFGVWGLFFVIIGVNLWVERFKHRYSVRNVRGEPSHGEPGLCDSAKRQAEMDLPKEV